MLVELIRDQRRRLSRETDAYPRLSDDERKAALMAATRRIRRELGKLRRRYGWRSV